MQKVCGIIISVLAAFVLTGQPVRAEFSPVQLPITTLYSSPFGWWMMRFWRATSGRSRTEVATPIPVRQPTPIRSIETATVTPHPPVTASPTPPSPTATPRAFVQPTTTPPAEQVLPSPTASPRSVTPSPRPVPTATPQASESSQGKLGILIAEINTYRAGFGLPSVQPNGDTCGFAATRVLEISSTFNHDGFRSRIEAGTLPYPSYSVVTENIARTSRFEEVVQLWINSPSHAAAMREDTPFVCVGIHGDYYAYEGLKP